jgi:uncharacterized membrane protein
VGQIWLDQSELVVKDSRRLFSGASRAACCGRTLAPWRRRMADPDARLKDRQILEIGHFGAAFLLAFRVLSLRRPR